MIFLAGFATLNARPAIGKYMSISGVSRVRFQPARDPTDRILHRFVYADAHTTPPGAPQFTAGKDGIAH